MPYANNINALIISIVAGTRYAETVSFKIAEHLKIMTGQHTKINEIIVQYHLVKIVVQGGGTK